jgi:hypothetical protein
VAEIAGRAGDQGREQALDLVAGQRDEPRRWWPLGPLGHGRDDQEGVGEHRQGDFRISDPPAGHRY